MNLLQATFLIHREPEVLVFYSLKVENALEDGDAQIRWKFSIGFYLHWAPYPNWNCGLWSLRKVVGQI